MKMGNKGRKVAERRFDHNRVIERYLKAIQQNGKYTPQLMPSYVNNL
jgi:hypothetical protein